MNTQFPIMEPRYMIRILGDDNHGFCTFVYEVDARVMLSHLRIVSQGTKHAYELVDLKTGSVIASTDD